MAINKLGTENIAGILSGKSSNPQEIEEKTDNYTLAFTDKDRLVTMNSGTNRTITIPADATTAFLDGTKIDIANIGTGTLTIAGASGVTLNGVPTILAQSQSAQITKLGDNNWIVQGYASVVSNGENVITASSSDVVPLTLNATSGQTANLLELRDSGGNLEFEVGPEGHTYVYGNIVSSGILRMTGDGSEIYPSIQPGNDSDTGIFRPEANTIGFTTLGSERMRINSSGNVGIGTTAPSFQLDIEAPDGSDANMRIRGGSTSGDDTHLRFQNRWSGGENWILFGDVDDVDAGYIYYDHDGDDMFFRVNGGGIRLGLRNNGAVTIGTANLGPASDSDLRVQNNVWVGGGIYLGGSIAGDNRLDDYEEGTFTPQFADATSGGNVASVSTATGQYTKIGDTVTVMVTLLNISPTGLTSSNDMIIRGLPFSPSSPVSVAIAYNAISINEATRYVGLVSGYVVRLESNPTNAANSQFGTCAELNAGGAADIRFTVTYKT